MDMLARFLRCMLCIAIMIPLREAFSLNYSYCKPQGLTSLFCHQCYTEAECANAKEVECTDESAVKTMNAILKTFVEAESTLKPVGRFMCVTFRSKQLGGLQSVVKGCLYYTEQETIVNHKFYYLKFYRHGRFSKWWSVGNQIIYEFVLERHKRDYWNETHFFSTHCWFCGDRSCNKMLVKKGTRILFQRKFLLSYDTECATLYAYQFDEFKKRCDENEVRGDCKNWWWPTVTYRPFPDPNDHDWE